MNEPNETRRSGKRTNTGVGRRPEAPRPQSFWGALSAMFRALLEKATRYHAARSG
jgi:hypothetical protein